jgi:hypothetical protein
MDKQPPRIVPYSEFEIEICPVSKIKHEIWYGLTGDMWPAFCVNGCNTVSNDPPEDLDL